MKKSNVVFVLLLTTIWVNGQNVGIGTLSPNSYGHGGTNRVLEINNADVIANAQSHLILTTASNTGSVGTVTWASPAIGTLEKRLGIVGISYDASNTPALTRSNMNFYTNDGSSVIERMRITYDGRVGIGTSTPRATLSMAASVGEKIILWDDGNVSGNNYGIGVQSGALQIHSYTLNDNISFGYGRSAALTERMRVINNGSDGMLLNGRLLLRNGSSPNDPAQGPGIWLYKPDNLGQLLGFIGAQDNQNMGFFGGPNLWGLTYNTVNSRIGIGTNNPTSLLNVNGQLTIDQKNFGGYGGLLIKGNVPGSNYPNIAFSIKNNAATPVDVVGAMIQGDLANNTAGAESIDLTFLTTNNGFGSLSEKLRIKGNGALSINGSTGNNQQLLISNGASTAASWATAGSIIKSEVSGVTNSVDLISNGSYPLTASTYTVNLSVPSRIILFYKTDTFKPCFAGSCDSKWIFSTYLNGNYVNGYTVIASSYGVSSDFGHTANTYGPDYFDLPAGTHTFTFTASNRFNNPSIYEFLVTSIIIPQ